MSDESEEVSSESTDSTPGVEESASQSESSGDEQHAAAPDKEQEEEHVPFHKHPRFTELIDQNRTYKSELDQYKGALEMMQRELQASRQAPKAESKPQESKHKQLIEQLKAVNPEFAAFQEEMLQNLEEAKKESALAKEVQKRLENYEQREFQTSAVSKLNSLYEQNNVPETLRKRYDREVRALAYETESQGKKLGLQDVEKLFKSVHDEYTPFIESLKRETLKGYVQSKKGDSAPAGATGGAAFTPGVKKFAPLGSQEGFSQTTKWLAEQLRAAKKQ